MGRLIAAAIAKAAEKNAVKGPRPRTSLGIFSPTGYWWGMAGAAFLCLVHYCTLRQHALWLVLYADDFEMSLMFHFFLCGRSGDAPEMG